jgi:hypothetical protein
LFDVSGGRVYPPPPDRWRHDLLPALVDVAAALNKTKASEFEVWLAAHIPAAVALGYYLSPKALLNRRVFWHQVDHRTGVESVRTCQNQPIPLSDDDRLNFPSTETGSADTALDIILELPISRPEVTRDVQKWLDYVSPVPRWRITGIPQGGPRQDSVQSGAQAATWVWQIGEQVRALWNARAEEVHLFVACPVAFAALLGQELYDRAAHQHPINLYAENHAQGYQRVCTLGEAASRG